MDALLAETKQRRTGSRGSALDYIRGVLAEPKASSLDALRAGAAQDLRLSTSLPAPVESSTPASMAPARSQWERFTLAEGMELHVRRPLSRTEQRQLEKLMSAARNIFDETDGEGQ